MLGYLWIFFRRNYTCVSVEGVSKQLIACKQALYCGVSRTSSRKLAKWAVEKGSGHPVRFSALPLLRDTPNAAGGNVFLVYVNHRRWSFCGVAVLCEVWKRYRHAWNGLQMPCLSLKFTSPLSDSVLSNRKEDRHHWQRSFRISSCCTTQQGNSSLGITSASFAWNLFSETPWSRENLGAVVLPGTRPYFRVACESIRFFCCCLFALLLFWVFSDFRANYIVFVPDF